MTSKKLLLTTLLLLVGLAAGAQTTRKNAAAKASKTAFSKANHFVYEVQDFGSDEPTLTEVFVAEGRIVVVPQADTLPHVQGYAVRLTAIDPTADSITAWVQYADSAYFYRTAFSRSDIEWTTSGSSRSRLHSCMVNSNRLVFEMDESVPLDISPLPYYGRLRGLLLRFERNGQTMVRLLAADRSRAPIPTLPEGARRVSPREMDRIVKGRMVVSTRLFDSVQLHWGEAAPTLGTDPTLLPTDTVLHFAGGTLAFRRIQLPQLPQHYRHFVELHQRSLGDAYDRTGSLFVIPHNYIGTYFTTALLQHPDSLPLLLGRDGERYQGVAATVEPTAYAPPVELVRFFTPFGVGHFNPRMADYGIDWRPEAYYRQEVTDLAPLLQGDVWLGIWIGNYDAGGHEVSVCLKSYPDDTHLSPSAAPHTRCIPLFNTCNVLEMAGQNYGKLFATDSLRVSFTLPANATSARLRYIATGHGGWDEGDEFVPKPNTLLVDGQVAYTYTPWREDCGTYRDLNPVSGNFWNGLSSSDFSRSGWCPGTATQPVFFDLMPWADGQPHTLCIAIPQGAPVDGMFSHWAISGSILLETQP